MLSLLHTTKTQDENISLKYRVAKEIRKKIMSGQYALGQKLSENKLSQEFNTSRAPVHDALLTLRNEGLVNVIPQRGSFVFNPSLEEINVMHEASYAYEVGALSLALLSSTKTLLKNLRKYLEQMREAGNNHEKWTLADRAFHTSIIQAGNNIHLNQAYNTISARTAVLVFHSTLCAERIAISLEQHAQIIHHIENKNFDLASKFLQHNNTGLEKFIEL